MPVFVFRRMTTAKQIIRFLLENEYENDEEDEKSAIEAVIRARGGARANPRIGGKFYPGKTFSEVVSTAFKSGDFLNLETARMAIYYAQTTRHLCGFC